MGEHLDKTVHIGQEDVAVDIGEDQVEKAAHMAQNLLVALKNLHLHTIDFAIVLGVAHAPVVNVVADNLAAPNLAATMPRMPVPQPQSRTCLPFNGMSRSEETIIWVVSWVPLPKAWTASIPT